MGFSLLQSLVDGRQRVLTVLSDAGVLQKVKSLVGWSAARGLSASSALDTTRVRLEAVSLQRVPAASRHEVYKGIAKGHYVFFSFLADLFLSGGLS